MYNEDLGDVQQSIPNGSCSGNLLKQVLDQVSPKPTEVIRATALRYPQKNRSNEFLPRTYYISMFHSSAFLPQPHSLLEYASKMLGRSLGMQLHLPLNYSTSLYLFILSIIVPTQLTNGGSYSRQRDWTTSMLPLLMQVSNVYIQNVLSINDIMLSLCRATSSTKGSLLHRPL